jgi:beta-glucosidase
MMAQTVEGMQEAGVQATAKHFIANEQELNRETMSSNVPDRVLRELYVWPFMDAIHSNVVSIMCSYNKINGSWACENGSMMNNLLKDELGFRGYIMSDWNGTSSSPSHTTYIQLTHIYSSTHHNQQRKQRPRHDHAGLRLQ